MRPLVGVPCYIVALLYGCLKRVLVGPLYHRVDSGPTMWMSKAPSGGRALTPSDNTIWLSNALSGGRALYNLATPLYGDLSLFIEPL